MVLPSSRNGTSGVAWAKLLSNEQWHPYPILDVLFGSRQIRLDKCSGLQVRDV